MSQTCQFNVAVYYNYMQNRHGGAMAAYPGIGWSLSLCTIIPARFAPGWFKRSTTSYARLYTTLNRRISFLLRTPWRCAPRSAEGAPLEVSLNRIGLSAGRLLRRRRTWLNLHSIERAGETWGHLRTHPLSSAPLSLADQSATHRKAAPQDQRNEASNLDKKQK